MMVTFPSCSRVDWWCSAYQSGSGGGNFSGFVKAFYETFDTLKFERRFENCRKALEIYLWIKLWVKLVWMVRIHLLIFWMQSTTLSVWGNQDGGCAAHALPQAKFTENDILFCRIVLRSLLIDRNVISNNNLTEWKWCDEQANRRNITMKLHAEELVGHPLMT